MSPVGEVRLTHLRGCSERVGGWCTPTARHCGAHERLVCIAAGKFAKLFAAEHLPMLARDRTMAREIPLTTRFTLDCCDCTQAAILLHFDFF